jgi:hypothetical protein
MTDGEQAREAIQRLAKVVTIANFGYARVQRHADSQRHPVRPMFRDERSLSRQSCSQPLARIVKGGTKGVADRLEYRTIV